MTKLTVIITVLLALPLRADDKKTPCPKSTDQRVECAEVKRGLFLGKWHVFGVFTRRELRGAGDPTLGAKPISAYPEVDLLRELDRRNSQKHGTTKLEQEKGTHPVNPPIPTYPSRP